MEEVAGVQRVWNERRVKSRGLQLGAPRHLEQASIFVAPACNYAHPGASGLNNIYMHFSTQERNLLCLDQQIKDVSAKRAEQLFVSGACKRSRGMCQVTGVSVSLK